MLSLKRLLPIVVSLLKPYVDRVKFKGRYKGNSLSSNII